MRWTPVSIVCLAGYELSPETARRGDDWQIDRCGSRWRWQEEEVGVRGEGGEERVSQGAIKRRDAPRRGGRDGEARGGDFSTPARGQQRSSMQRAQQLSLTC